MEKDPILKDPTVAQPTAIMGTKNIRACGAKAPHSTCSLFFAPTGLETNRPKELNTR